MKTLADVKRRMKVGLVFTCEHHTHPLMSGFRTVTKVQTNAIAYTWSKPGVGDRIGWLHWGKAADWRVEGDSATCVDRTTGNPVFTYHFVAEREGK